MVVDGLVSDTEEDAVDEVLVIVVATNIVAAGACSLFMLWPLKDGLQSPKP